MPFILRGAAYGIAVLTGLAQGLFQLPLILMATTYDAVGARWIVAPAVVATSPASLAHDV